MAELFTVGRVSELVQVGTERFLDEEAGTTDTLALCQ